MAPRLLHAAPVLLVKDVKAAAETYAERLGFTIRGFWGEPPGFSIVDRGGAAVMLAVPHIGGPFRPNPDYDRPSAYIYVEDVDGLYAELQQRGADILCAPEDQPHGCREIIVRDLDGHHLIFGQDLA